MTPPWAGRPTASLFGQLLALIGLSLAAAQVISLILLFNLPPPAPDFYRVSEIVQAFHGTSPAFTERRPLVLKIVDRPPTTVMALEGRMTLKIRSQLAEALGVPDERVVISSSSHFPVSDRRIFRVIRDRMARDGGEQEEHFLIAPFDVALRRDDGRWEIVRPERGIGLDPWQQRIVLLFFLSALVMTPIAFVFARRLSAPITLFTDAAERLGRDPRAPPLSVKGSAEITVAVRAFNDMQERLRRYVEDRTAMVGAIAHDLRTPLTRLRFRIENVPEDVRIKMSADIDQMEDMISAALAFVRDTTREGERTPLELSSLLESLCDEMAETGADTQVELGQKVVLHGDPLALRRLFTNLLENAVKFGNRARARVYSDAVSVIVEIEDDGPGIPPDEVERVFEPFYRREPSRSRQTGGIGLGLAVVRSIARGHGGDVMLINRQGGGLTARVQLPI
ncbi:MAG: ATP-binding protein [Pseudomonadota bacterium]|uniref:ATP-binding protein n=1 Tax=unclassified Phenylobacterium TaxID=2640670 RepID=UPI0006F933BE|nr:MULTISPECIES: ATP-binding protein [unclassified Phenylobacterium]KRB44676.1 histidine kinase [Phenylobacterium sp. Root700]MBT9472177.1 HAMP domain-containing protein [Phenylobacterium sp.]